MRYLVLLCLLSGVFSCNQNKQSEISSDDITFEIDTVTINSKGEILFLQYNVSLSDFSEDKKYLYNFSLHNHSIEKIDLEKLEFIERFPFQKEGPNGVGQNVNVFQRLKGEEFYFGSFMERGIHNLTSEKLKNLKFDAEDLNPKFPPGHYISGSNNLLMGNKDEIFGLTQNIMDGGFQVGLIGVEKKQWESFPTPEFDHLNNFRTALMGERGPSRITGYSISLNQTNQTMVISNNVGADIYVFDEQSRKLKYIPFDHQLFPSRKKGAYPAQVETVEEFNAINRAFGEEINFQPPVWDEDNQRYYRFSYQNIWKEVEGAMKATGAKVYLTILDNDFNILKELPVEEMNQRPNYHFVKDGKIWIFENMDDEMGFVRLSFN